MERLTKFKKFPVFRETRRFIIVLILFILHALSILFM